MNLVRKLMMMSFPCLLLAACALQPASPAAPGQEFGATARAAFARQVVALPSTAPVTGIDGTAALQAQQAYRKSYAEREAYARPLIIGVGAQK